MDADALLANFETLATAQGGVVRLRELILQLAVQGRLVEQDAAEGMAHDVLTAIAKDDERPQKNRRLPLSSDLGVIPASWEWVRLGDLTPFAIGRTPRTKVSEYWSPDGVPWVSIGDMSNGATVVATAKRVSEKAVAEVFRTPPVQAGTLLMSFKLTIGKVSLLGVDAYHNEAIISLPLAFVELRDYLFNILPIASRIGDTRNAIKGKTLNKASLSALPVPLPPLAEQHRIVAKVDELMALCDELETRQVRRQTVRQATQRSALAALTAADSPDALAHAWDRVQGHWGALTAHSDSVPPLRQAILQLAVQGRLVTQDAGDEALRDLGDVADLQNGYAFKSQWYSKKGLRLVRNANVSHGYLDWADIVYLPESRAAKFERFFLEDGDIVLSLDRPLISTGLKVARICSTDLPALLLQRVARISVKEVEELDSDFLFLWFCSPLFTDGIDPGRSKGVPHISTKQLAKLSISLPSLIVQRETVQRAVELTALCDDLETRLQRQETTATNLAAATVHALAS